MTNDDLLTTANFECEDDSNTPIPAHCEGWGNCLAQGKCLLREAMNPIMPDDRFYEVDEFNQPIYPTDR